MVAYPEHLHGFDYRGFFRYFLTFTTFERNAYFVADEPVGLVWTQFLRAAREHDIAAITYCFMPDHVHLLIEGTREDADAKAFIKKAKQYSGFYFRRASGKHLWQRYGYERTLRADEDTATVARYIVANPVRAGLVQHPSQYPYWGSERYPREELLEYICRAG